MRRTLLAATAATAILATGLGGADAFAQRDPVAAVVKKAESRPRGRLAEQEAYEALFAGLPQGVTATAESFEEDGRRGVVARGVTIRAAGEDGLGVSIDELRAYGLDPDAASVLSTDAEDGERLARRIDARGVVVMGLAALSEAVSDAAADAMEGTGATIDQSFDEYEVRIARVVVDDLELFGGMVAIPEDEDGEAALRRYAQFSRAYAMDRMLATETELVLAYSQEVTVPAQVEVDVDVEVDVEVGAGAGEVQDEDAAADDAAEAEVAEEAEEAAPAEPQGAPQTRRSEGEGRFVVARYGVDGYDRGDAELTFAEGVSGTMRVSDPGEGVDVSYDFGAARTTQAGVRVADALGYFVRGEVPPSDRTDLMSLGVLRLEDMSVSMLGEPFQTIDGYEVDLSAWHGLLPERVAVTSQEVFHLGGLMRMIEQGQAQASAAMGEAAGTPEAARAQLAALATILAEAGLEAIRSDNAFAYEWAPGDGQSSITASSTFADLGAYDLTIEGELPPYEGFAAIDPAALRLSAPDAGADVEADMEAGAEAPSGRADAEEAAGAPNPLARLMNEESKVSRLVLTLDDAGGLDRVLGAVVAYAELPENAENPQLAMVRGQDAASLRTMLSAGVSMASAQLAQVAPEAQEMAATASTWLREGGRLTITMNPERPMGAAEFDAVMGPEDGPGELIAALGLAVTHEAAAPTEE